VAQEARSESTKRGGRCRSTYYFAHAITFTGGEAKQQYSTKKGTSPVHKQVREYLAEGIFYQKILHLHLQCKFFLIEGGIRESSCLC